MSHFKVHDAVSAPEESKPLLERSLRSFGMVPNLHGVMAEAPGLLEGYQVLHELFLASSLSAEEKTVIWQAINVEHNCLYCVPAHTSIAKAMKISSDVLNALRNEQPLPSPRLEALRHFTLSLLRKRGELAPEEVEEFYAAGYSRRNVLEVVLGLSQKVMSNYVNHIAKTPIDNAFSKYFWK